MTQAILTEQERNDIEDKVEMVIGDVAFDAIEEAIIAKLGSAPMPDGVAQRLKISEDAEDCWVDVDPPTDYEKGLGWEPLFTESQLQQAYLQGAAAQLSAKPVERCVLRSGNPTLLSRLEIVPTDVRLYTLKGQQ